MIDQRIGEAHAVIPEVQGFGRAVAGNGFPQQFAASVDVAGNLRCPGDRLSMDTELHSNLVLTAGDCPLR